MTPRLLAPLFSGALLVSGCAGGAAPAIDTAVADELAARADALAGQLAASDGCGARSTADELVATTEAALSERALTEPVAAEIIRTTRDAVAAVPCEPPAPADDDGDDAEPEGKAKGQDEGKGKKGDKGKGRGGGDD